MKCRMLVSEETQSYSFTALLLNEEKMKYYRGENIRCWDKAVAVFDARKYKSAIFTFLFFIDPSIKLTNLKEKKSSVLHHSENAHSYDVTLHYLAYLTKCFWKLLYVGSKTNTSVSNYSISRRFTDRIEGKELAIKFLRFRLSLHSQMLMT